MGRVTINCTQSQFFDKRSGRAERSCKKSIPLALWDAKGRSISVRLLPTGRKNGNPHCHLVYNRINNEGKTITDQNDFRRNEQVTKLLKRKYGLTFSKGKYNSTFSS